MERLKSSFRKFYGRYWNLIQQYEVFLSRMLNGILTLDHLSDFQTDQNFHKFSDLDTELDLHRIASGSTEHLQRVTCQQWTFPDTWFRPLVLTCLSSNCSDQFSRTCRIFSWLFTLNIHRSFLNVASKYLYIIWHIVHPRALWMKRLLLRDIFLHLLCILGNL